VFFLYYYLKEELRVLKCEELGPELDRKSYQKNLTPLILEFFKKN